MYFLAFVVLFTACLFALDRTGKYGTFTGTVLTKQRRTGNPDLFYVEIWYECPNGPNVYGLFVDESDFNRLWEDDIIKFTAKKGRIWGWLYNRKLTT